MYVGFRPTWFSASYTVHQAILDGIDDHREIARDAKLRFIITGSGPTSAVVVRGLGGVRRPGPQPLLDV
jgi:hypothetical protein